MPWYNVVCKSTVIHKHCRKLIVLEKSYSGLVIKGQSTGLLCRNSALNHPNKAISQRYALFTR